MAQIALPPKRPDPMCQHRIRPNPSDGVDPMLKAIAHSSTPTLRMQLAAAGFVAGFAAVLLALILFG